MYYKNTSTKPQFSAKSFSVTFFFPNSMFVFSPPNLFCMKIILKPQIFNSHISIRCGKLHIFHHIITYNIVDNVYKYQLLVFYYKNWFYYKYCFAEFQEFSIKRTVRSECQKIVLFNFITVMYFLLNVLVLLNIPYNISFKALTFIRWVFITEN